jgi:hypothetical protein
MAGPRVMHPTKVAKARQGLIIGSFRGASGLPTGLNIPGGSVSRSGEGIYVVTLPGSGSLETDAVVCSLSNSAVIASLTCVLNETARTLTLIRAVAGTATDLEDDERVSVMVAFRAST